MAYQQASNFSQKGGKADDKKEKTQEKIDRGGINWMYQSTATTDEQKKADEESYLLGKEFNPNKVKSGDLAVGDESVGISRVVENISATSEKAYVGRNENFHLRHEDPMYMVNQTWREKERGRRKKKKMFEKAAVSSLEDRRHNEKKSRRRTGSRHRERSSSISSSKDKRRKRRKRKDKKRRKRRQRSYSSGSGSSSDNSNDSASDTSKYYECHYKKIRNHSGRDRNVSRSRSTSIERKPKKHRKHRKHSRRERTSHDNNSASDHSFCKNENRNDDKKRHKKDDLKKNDASSTKEKLYGLISFKSQPKQAESRYLGPDEQLIARKQQDKVEARNRYRQQSRNRDTRMTVEERKTALNEMQHDANNRVNKLSRASESQKNDLHDEEIQRRLKSGCQEASSFVHDMMVKVHGISNDNAPSLAEHVAQSKNTFQKASDDRFL